MSFQPKPPDSTTEDLHFNPKRRQPSAALGRSSYSFPKAVQQLQHQRNQVQSRTFTRWINAHLCKSRPPLEIKSLDDIKDGTKLLTLLELLSGEKLIKLVNIHAAEVVNGNPSIVLGLIWTIILYFQIEELTNNLALSRDLSGSTSSLDSFAESDNDLPERKRGAKAKWQGAAKKALLQWVKRKTKNKPPELQVAIQDFGPSWRDGRAFLSLIHSINPSLVQNAPEEDTNRQRLERAFSVAQHDLDIPRLLEPDDVDVDRPDEKSIMTYVAQFVKQYGGLEEESKDARQVDEDLIQHDVIMTWLDDAQQQLNEVRKRHKYRQQDYLDFRSFKSELDQKHAEMKKLHDKWLTGNSRSVNSDQIDSMLATFQEVQEKAKEWHRELDSRLPGQFGDIGAWLHQAENFLATLEHGSTTEVDGSTEGAAQQIDQHKKVFKDLPGQTQAFQKLRRAHRFSGQSIPLEQLQDISDRLKAIKQNSVEKLNELKLRDVQQRLDADIEAMEDKLALWNTNGGDADAAERLLADYQNAEGLATQLEGGLRMLLEAGPDDEKVKEFLKEKKEKVRALCSGYEETGPVLERAVRSWREFQNSYNDVKHWLQQTAAAMHNSEVVVEDWKEWKDAHSRMVECGNALAESCGEAVSQRIGQDVARLTQQARHVFERCEVNEKQARFDEGVEEMQEWLADTESLIHQPLPLSYNAVRARLQNLEDVDDETSTNEEQFKEMSTLAQSLVKKSSPERVKAMLEAMTGVKNRLVQIRRSVTEMMTSCADMLAPLQSLDGDLDSLDDWLDDAQRIMDSYQLNEVDFDSQYQQHENFFSTSDDQKKKLARAKSKLRHLTQAGLPEANVEDTKFRLAQSSSRLLACLDRAEAWQPKLKTRTETLQTYRASLQQLEKFLARADAALMAGRQDGSQEHENLLADADQAVEEFMRASNELMAVSESDDMKQSVAQLAERMQDRHAALVSQLASDLANLRWKETEKEFNTLLHECSKELSREEARLAEQGDYTSLLEVHAEFFDKRLPQIERLLQLLAESDDVTAHERNLQDLLSDKRNLYSKLCQLPEKVAEFEMELDRVEGWLGGAEQLIERAHKPIEPGADKIRAMNKAFKDLLAAKDKHLSSLEWLSGSLQFLCGHLSQKQANICQERLLSVTSRSKAVLNSFASTEKRMEAITKCIEYRSIVEESISLVAGEIQSIENLQAAAINNQSDARKAVAIAQSTLERLNDLSSRISSDISRGKELHADEQAPAFLYTDVTRLEKCWKKLEDAADKCYNHVAEMNKSWEQHASWAESIDEFLTQANQTLSARLRLSTLPSVKQEISGATELRTKVAEAFEVLASIQAWSVNLLPSVDENHQQDVEKSLSDWRNALQLVDSRANDLLSRLNDTKSKWEDCEKKVVELDHRLRSAQNKIGEIENSSASSSQSLKVAGELVAEMRGMEDEVKEVERRCGGMEGLERPTTIDAKLTTLRGKWKEVLVRAEALVLGLEEETSLRDKFHSLAAALTSRLEGAELLFDTPPSSFTSLDELKDAMDEHERCVHNLNKLRLDFAGLQSAVKLLKDEGKGEELIGTLQQRYDSVSDQGRQRGKLLDDVFQRWHSCEEQFDQVRNFLDRCELLLDDEQAVLPGDQNKLQRLLDELDALAQLVAGQQDSAADLKDDVEGLKQMMPLDIDEFATEIAALELLLSDLPRRFIERRRVVSAALGSHIQYEESIESFTQWLVAFERAIRDAQSVYMDDVESAIRTIKAQREEVESHQQDYQALASHLEDLRTMCDAKERKTLVTRYTECTKFLGRVCELVSAREDALDKLLAFSQLVQKLISGLEGVDDVLACSAATHNDISQCQDDADQFKRIMAECVCCSAGLDAALQQAQLTTLDSKASGKRIAVKSYVNRLQARCELIYSQIAIKLEHFEEVDDVWQSFFDRKEKLLKVIEDLEERAEVDVVVDSLSRDKIQPFRQLYDRLEEELAQRRYDFDGVVAKGKRLMEVDPSQESSVKEHIKLLQMTWDDTLNLVTERRGQLEKLSGFLEEYERAFVSVEGVLKRAEKVVAIADSLSHFTAEEVKGQLQKLKTLKDEFDEKQQLMDELSKLGKAAAAEAKKQLVSDGASIDHQVEASVDRYLDIGDRIDEVMESLRQQLSLWEELLHEDEEIEEWFNSSVVLLNTSASSLDDSSGLKDQISDVKLEIDRRQRRYEDLQRKVTEMHAARVHCSVGELDGVAQVNENMKGKLELATASFKKAKLKLDDFLSQRANLETYVAELIDWLALKETKLTAVRSVQQAKELEAEFLSQRDNIESTKEHLASLCRRYQSGELKDVQGNVAKLIAKHADLLLAIQKKIKSLEEGMDEELHSASREFTTWLQTANDELLACADASGDGEALEEKLRALHKLNSSLDEGERLYATLSKVSAMQPDSHKDAAYHMKAATAEWEEYKLQLQDEITIVETTLAMLRPLEQRYHKLHEAIKSIESGLFGNDVIEGNVEEKRIQYNSLQKLLKDLKERSKDVEYLMKLSHELVEYNAAQQASTRKIHHIISTYHALCKQIKEKTRLLENKLKEHTEYEVELGASRAWLAQAHRKLLAYRDALPFSTVQQLEEMLGKLQQLIDDKQAKEIEISKLLGKGERVATSSAPEQASIMRSDLDELKTGLQQFGDDLEEGCSLAKKQLAGWNQFNQSRDELVAWLGEKQQQYSAGIPSALDLKGKEILLEQAKLSESDVLSYREAVEFVRVKAAMLKQDDQFKAIEHAYNEVRNKAEESRTELERRVREHKEFHESCQHFSDWITSVREELGRWADAAGADKQSAQKKLQKIKNLKSTRMHGRAKLDAAEEAGTRVLMSSTEAGQQAIQQEMDSLRDDWRAWERNLTGAEISLERKVREAMEREESLAQDTKELLGAVNKLLNGLDGISLMEPPSQESAQMMETANKCKVASGKLADLQVVSDEVKRRLNEMCWNYSDAEIGGLSQDATTALKRYEGLRFDAEKCWTDTVRQLNASFLAAVREFEAWLKSAEELVYVNANDSMDSESAQRKLNELHDTISKKKEGEDRLGLVGSLGDCLVSSLGSDVLAIVPQKMKQCREGWARLVNAAQSQEHALTQRVEVLDEFDRGAAEITEWLQLAEERCGVEEGYSIATMKRRLSTLKVLAEEIADQQYKFESVKRKAQKLGALEIAYIKRLFARYHALTTSVQDALAITERRLTELQAFEDAHAECAEWLDDYRRRLDSYAALAGGRELLDQRLEKIKQLVSSEQEFEAKQNALQGRAERVLAGACDAVRDHVEKKRSSICNTWQEESQRARACRDKIVSALALWDAHKEAVTEANSWLEQINRSLQSEKKVSDGQAGEAVAHRLDKCRALHQEVLDGESVMDRVRTFAEKIVEATYDAAGTRVDTAELREAYRNTVNASQELLDMCESSARSVEQYRRAFEAFRGWFAERPLTLFQLANQHGDVTRIEENLKILMTHQSELPEGEELLKLVISAGKLLSDKTVKLQLQGLKEEWSAYVSSMNESLEKLEKSLDVASKFEALRLEFQDWIASMETCPDSEIELSHELQRNREALDRFQRYSGEVIDHRPHLEKLNAVAQRLVDSKPAGKSPGSEIAILTSRYHSLVLNVRERLKSCQTAVLLHAEVTADSEELREWMESAEERLHAHTPPQFSRIEVCCEELDKLSAECAPRKALLSLVADKCQRLTSSMSSKHHRLLMKDAHTLQQRFQKLHTEIEDAIHSLSDTFHAQKDYSALMASLNAWLQEVQAKLEAEPSIRTELIEKKAQLARCIGYHDELSRKKDDLAEAADRSKRLPQSDTDELERTSKQFSDLQYLCNGLIQRVKSQVKTHQEFDDSYHAAEKWLLAQSAAVSSVPVQNLFADAPSNEVNHNLLEYTVVQESLARFHLQLDNVQACAAALLRLHQHDDNVQAIVHRQLQELQNTYDNVRTAVTHMVEKLRSLASQQRSFDMKIAEAELWISEKQAEVEFLPLPSSAFEAEQRSKDIIALLDDVNDKIAYFEEECANEGDGRLVEKLKEFRGRLERLLDESVVREREWAEVHAAHTAFKNWCNKMRELLHDLDEFQVEIAPGSAKEHALKCRRTFDEIQDKKSELVVLEEKYYKLCGAAGADMLRGSMAEWENLFATASDLNQTQQRNMVNIDDYNRSVDEAEEMVRSFQERLVQMLGNNSDATENRIEQAKNFQSEMQLQKPTLHQLTDSTSALSPRLNLSNLELVEDKCRRLQRCWFEMEQKVAARIQILSSVLAEMNSYLKQLGSARAWLEDALTQTELPVPQTLSVEDLDSSRKRHESLQRELLQRRDDFNELSAANQILPLSLALLEREQLQAEVNAVQQLFWKVQQALASKLTATDHAIVTRKDLWSTSQELLAWLAHMKESLVKPLINPLHPDMVAKQIQEHKVLYKEIIRRKEDVDAIVATGVEIIYEGKVESVSVRGKLAELQDRYKQVDEMWRSRMDGLRLLLAQRELFHADVERCLRWLKEADVITFPSVNPASSYEELQLQLSRYEAISKEAVKYREVIKKISDEADLILLELSEVDQELLSTKMKGIENQFDRVCQASEEKWSLGKEMVESRMQYSRMLKQLEDHLAVGQSVLSEMDDLPTGHTAGHARTLMHRAQNMQASMVEYKEELASLERMRDELKDSGQPWMPDELLKASAVQHRLNQQVQQRIDRFADMSTFRERFEREMMEANDQVTEWGQQLECFSPGTAEQRLAKYQEMAAAIAIEQLTLRSLAGQAEQLCGDMDFTDKAIIQNKVDNLTKDLVELQSRLENKQKDLESRIVSHQDFHDELDEGIQWLDETCAALQCQIPLKLDPQFAEQEMKRTQLIKQEVESRVRILSILGTNESSKYVRDGGQLPPHLANKMKTIDVLKMNLKDVIAHKQENLKQALEARERYMKCLSAVQSKLAGACAELKLLEGDTNPEHARNLLDQYQALFTVEGEIVDHVDDLEEASDCLRTLPHVMCLTNDAHASLQSTVANVRAKAGSVLATAKEVHNTLQSAALNWESFELELERVAMRIAELEDKLKHVVYASSPSLEEAHANMRDFKRLLSEISALDSGVQSLREAASNLLCDGSESGRVAVARLLTAIDRRLSRLNSRAQEIGRMLGHNLREWQSHDDNICTLSEQLNAIETRLSSTAVESCTSSQLNQRRSQLHSISDDVSSLQRRLSILHDSAQTLASQPNNKEPFQDVARQIEDRSEKLMLELSEQLLALNSEIESRELMTMELEEMLGWLHETNDRVAESCELGATAGQVAGTLHTVRQLKKEATGKEGRFNELLEQQRLKYLSHRTALPVKLSALVAKLQLAFGTLHQELKRKEEELEGAQQLREDYHNELMLISADLSHIETRLTQSPGTTQDKQEELDRCLVRLVDLDARAQEIAEQTPDEASKDSLKNAVNAVNEHYSQVQELYHNVRSQQMHESPSPLKRIEEKISELRPLVATNDRDQLQNAKEELVLLLGDLNETNGSAALRMEIKDLISQCEDSIQSTAISPHNVIPSASRQPSPTPEHGEIRHLISRSLRDIASQLTECQQELEASDQQNDPVQVLTFTQGLLDKLNSVIPHLEQVEREISSLPRSNAGKEAFHAALSILYDRWDTLRMQVTSTQSTAEVHILEDEQYRRMVEAYRAELQNMSDWLGRQRSESHSDISSVSSSDAIHKQLKKCKTTVSDIERKLKLLGELSKCSVSSVGMSEAGKSLIHEFESVRDELESLQVDAESEKKALQEALEDRTKYDGDPKDEVLGDLLERVKDLKSTLLEPDNLVDNLLQHQAEIETLANSLEASAQADLPGDELWRRLAERIESSRVDCDAVQANLLMAETHHYEVVSFRSVKLKLDKLKELWPKVGGDDDRECVTLLKEMCEWLDNVKTRLMLVNWTEEHGHEIVKNVGSVASVIRSLKIESQHQEVEYVEEVLSGLLRRGEVLLECARVADAEGRIRKKCWKQLQVDAKLMTAQANHLGMELNKLWRAPPAAAKLENAKKIRKQISELSKAFADLSNRATQFSDHCYPEHNKEMHKLRWKMSDLMLTSDSLLSSLQLHSHDKVFHEQLLSDFKKALKHCDVDRREGRVVVEDIPAFQQLLQSEKDFLQSLFHLRALCLAVQPSICGGVEWSECVAKHDTVVKFVLGKIKSWSGLLLVWEDLAQLLEAVEKEVDALEHSMEELSEPEEAMHRSVAMRADLNQCQVLASQLFASVSCESLNAKLIECERKVPVLSDKIRSVCEKAYVMEEAWPRMERYCGEVEAFVLEARAFIKSFLPHSSLESFKSSVEELDRLLDRCNATSILYDELLLIEASLDGFVDKRVGDAKLEWLEVLEEISRFCTEISQNCEASAEARNKGADRYESRKWKTVLAKINKFKIKSLGHGNDDSFQQQIFQLLSWSNLQLKIAESMVSKRWGGVCELQLMIGEFRKLQQELKEKRNEMIKLQKTTETDDIRQAAASGAQLDKLRQSWALLEHYLSSLAGFEEGLESWARYNSTEKAALGIISAAELALVEDSCQWESVEDKIKKLKGHLASLPEHDLHVRMLAVEASCLVERCQPRFVRRIDNKLGAMKDRWREFCDALKARLRAREMDLVLMKDHDDMCTDMEEQLKRVNLSSNEDCLEIFKEEVYKLENYTQQLDVVNEKMKKLKDFPDRLLSSQLIARVLLRNRRLRHNHCRLSLSLSYKMSYFHEQSTNQELHRNDLKRINAWLTTAYLRSTENDPNIRDNFTKQRTDLHAFATFSEQMSSINCQARTTPLSEEHLSALDALNDRWNEALSSGAARCGAQHRLMLEELSFEEMCEEWLLFVTQLQVTLATPLSWEGLLEQARTLDMLLIETCFRQPMLWAIVDRLQLGSSSFRRALTLCKQWAGILKEVCSRKRKIEAALKNCQALNVLLESFRADVKTCSSAKSLLDSIVCKLSFAPYAVYRLSRIEGELNNRRALNEEIIMEAAAWERQSGQNLALLQEEWKAGLMAVRDARVLFEQGVTEWQEFNDVIDHVLITSPEASEGECQPLHTEVIKQKKNETLLELSRNKLSSLPEFTTGKFTSVEDSRILSLRWELARSFSSRNSAWNQCHKLQLQERLSKWGEFEDAYSDTGEWLIDLERKVLQAGDKETLETYEEESSFALPCDINKLAVLQQLVNNLPQSSREEAEKKLSKLQDKWHYLQGMLRARGRKVEETAAAISQLDTSLHDLSVWLQDIELLLYAPLNYDACTDGEIKQKLAQQQDLQADIAKHSNGVASVLHLCDFLRLDDDACAQDMKAMEEASKSLDQRWNNIRALSIDRKFKIEDTHRSWKKFLHNFSSFSDWLVKCETTAKYHDFKDVTYEEARTQLKHFETFQRQIYEGRAQLEVVNTQYRMLARERRTDAAQKIKQMVLEGNRRWDELSKNITAIIKRLKHVIERRELFEAERESTLVWLTESDVQLTNLEHFTNAPDTDKLKLLKEIQNRVLNRLSSIQAVDDRGKALLSSSQPSDCSVIEKELADFHQCCRDVVSQLDRYHKKLLQLTNSEWDLPYLSDQAAVTQLDWWEFPENDEMQLDVDKLTGEGRDTPLDNGSLEWDGYDCQFEQISDDSLNDDEPSADNDSSEVAEQLSADIDSLLDWLNTSTLSNLPEDPSTEDLVKQAKTLRECEKALESRKALKLSIDLIAPRVSSGFCSNKLKKVNRKWQKFNFDLLNLKQELDLKSQNYLGATATKPSQQSQVGEKENRRCCIHTDLDDTSADESQVGLPSFRRDTWQRTINYAFVLLFLLYVAYFFTTPYCDDDAYCLNQNTLHRSWYPLLTCMSGPPPM